jgi:hypothetical protein
MGLTRFFRNTWQRVRDRFAFLNYKIKQRRALKKNKANDPNIYPSW